MTRQNRRGSSGRTQNGGKEAASKAAVAKATPKENGKDAGKDAAPRLPLGEEINTRPTFRRERAALKRGVWPIAGCDEAGRRPPARPGVAAPLIPRPRT